MKVIDDGTKKLTAWNRNYFFVVTVLITALCITLHACLGPKWSVKFLKDIDGIYVTKSFFNSFAHVNWQHCLLNMLCFFICGCWLERRYGSLRYSLLLFFTIFSTSWATSGSWGVNVVGYSAVNYGLYAYTIVDFIFSLQKSKRNLSNTIGGSVMMALIYFAMCFNGGTERVSFELYPYDLFNNYSHYVGFLVMLLVAIIVHIARYLESHNKL